MKSFHNSAGVGASSILMIMVVLCLTVFGMLSLMSARVDVRLEARTREKTEAFYSADADAQKCLITIDAGLQDGLSPETLEGVNVRAQGDGTYRFTVRADSERVLETVFVVTGDTAGPRYEIISYRLINMTQWAEETQLPSDALISDLPGGSPVDAAGETPQ